MSLSDFIRANIDPILECWERFAKAIPSARKMDTTALHDHARGILLAIAADLEQPQTLFEQAEKAQGRGPCGKGVSEAAMHGAARVVEGFSINEAMAEFRALRASVLRLWHDKHTFPYISGDQLTRFNEAIDQALGESLARYSADRERNTRLFDTLLSSSPDLNYIFDTEGKFIYANRALAGLYGMSLSEIVGKNFRALGASIAAEFERHLQHVVEQRDSYRGEMLYTLPSGAKMTYEFLYVPVIGTDGKVEAVAGTARNVTERKETEERIRRSANYDFLTELPNRSMFRDRLEQEVRRAVRSGQQLALFFIDLDGFKEVNDRLGHDAGDQLLRQAAGRISACVRDTDMVARIGGDEFTVILVEVGKLAHVEILAQKILEQLARPFSVAQTSVQISGSIGITLFPQDATGPENLLRNADQAMYVAKHAGRNRFSFFTLSMRESAWARLKLIDELRCALPRHELSVYYQPIVDLQRAGIVKAEALLRWHHPQAGLMYPDAFVWLAEETGLIGEIDDWVLGQAAPLAQAWSGLLGSAFQISVNKSPVEFMNKSFVRNWERVLTQLGLAWNCISVEMTEGVLLNDSASVREALSGLQQAGVQLAIDDFGTGYSSMAYLKKFKVDYLKIDQSFVRDMSSGSDSRIFAETIIVMAHKLGLKVIAEGVETAEQKDWLKMAGCDYAQGYFFSEAVPSPEFEKLLQRQLTAAS